MILFWHNLTRLLILGLPEEIIKKIITCDEDIDNLDFDSLDSCVNWNDRETCSITSISIPASGKGRRPQTSLADTLIFYDPDLNPSCEFCRVKKDKVFCRF